MPPRLRLAASVAALGAAWGLGMLAERARSSTAGGAKADAAMQQLADTDATARRDAVRDAERRAAREDADAFTARSSAPPRDLAARLENARCAPSEIQRARRLIIATNDLTAEEIPGALALAAQSGGQKNAREILRMVLLARWAELDPPAAVAYTMQNLTDERGWDSEIIETVVGEWGVRDPAAAADFVAGLDASMQEKALSGLLAGVATSQPETALALLTRFPDTSNDGDSYKLIFGAWSERNPRGAAARAAGLPVGGFRNGALAGVTESWAQYDPAAAYSWATQLGTPAEREIALNATLHIWAERDPQSAANQARGLAGAALLEAVSDEITRQLAIRDLASAQRFAAQLTDQSARASAQEEVAQRMSEKNPAEAAAYAAQMPEGNARTSAYSTLSAKWVRKDPVATAQWLGTLPAGDSRDAAVAAYVERAAEIDPESALAWAASVEVEGKRSDAIIKAYQAWQKSAPQAAQAWLGTNRTRPDKLRAALTPRE